MIDTKQSNQSARIGALQSVELRKILADGTVCPDPFFTYKPPGKLKRLGEWLIQKLLLKPA